MRRLHGIALVRDRSCAALFVIDEVTAFNLIDSQAPPDFFAAPVALLDQFVEVIESPLAPLHQARMLDWAQNLTPIMRDPFI
ncbi:MAG: hypothetical protein INH43_04795 [Acidobacteriaceae bacterium]|nr:hypothetical protein [Acidobacteriaceae bacterium]